MHSDFWLFELSIWLHVLARSLITVFVPILLLTTGYSIGEVMIYYFLYNLFDVPLNWFARYMTRQLGARKVMILATIAVIAFFLTLGFLVPGNWPLLILLGVFAALYDVFYWVAHTYLFIVASREEKDTSSSTSWLYIVKRIASLLGPALGAGILLLANKEILIAVSIALFILSLIPLFRAKHLPDKPQEPTLSFKEFFKAPEERTNYLSTMFFSVHRSAEAVLWPLFIYITFASIGSVAIVPIIVSLTAILFSYFAGKIHKKDRSKMIILGSILIALMWIIRLSFDATVIYYITIFLVGLFSLLINIPLDSNLFERDTYRDPLSAATYRNASSMFIKIFLYGGLALLVSVFQVSFIIAMISLLLLLLVNYFFIAHQEQKLDII